MGGLGLFVSFLSFDVGFCRFVWLLLAVVSHVSRLRLRRWSCRFWIRLHIVEFVSMVLGPSQGMQ